MKGNLVNANPPIVADDSPFRRLSDRIPINQILFLDAIRLSTEMADQAYRRLYDLLFELTDEGKKGIAVPALSDAYTVVDSIYRYQGVLRSTPGIKHNEVFELFMRRTAGVEPLRHIVQHLNNQIRKIAADGWSALGTLTWIGPSVDPNGPGRMCILQPGTFYPSEKTVGPMVDLAATAPPGQIADISLTTSGVRVNLSHVIQALRENFKSLEVPVGEIDSEKGHRGSDALIRIDLIPVTNDQNTDGPYGQ